MHLLLLLLVLVLVLVLVLMLLVLFHGRLLLRVSAMSAGDVGVLRSEMWYAVELSATATVPEWDGQAVQFRQEENGVISTTGTNHFAFRRQDVFHMVY